MWGLVLRKEALVQNLDSWRGSYEKRTLGWSWRGFVILVQHGLLRRERRGDLEEMEGGMLRLLLWICSE